MSRGDVLAGALLALALAIPGPAAEASGAPPAATAGFAGHWRLDLPASQLGKGPRVPRWREDHIRNQGADLAVRATSVRQDGDTLRLEFRYPTAGEAVNRMAGQDVRTRGRRDGDALVFESEAQLALFKFEVSERWTLSDDGATLTQERTARSPMGQESQRLVFRRLGREAATR